MATFRRGSRKTVLGKWNATKLADANFCSMLFWLKYIKRAPQPQKPAFVKGGLLHRVVEHFWDRLGSEEEVMRDAEDKKKPADEKRKYFDAFSFGDYVHSLWMQDAIMPDNRARETLLILTDPAKRMEYLMEHFEKLKLRHPLTEAQIQRQVNKTRDKTIDWGPKDVKDMNASKYRVTGGMRRIGRGLFPILLAEGPALFSELPIDFVLEGIRFNGKIDDIRMREVDGRQRLVIRDYKSGRPWINSSKVNYDPQLTFYNIGICAMCYPDTENAIQFAEKLGLSSVRKQFCGNPYWAYDDIITEYFMIEAAAIEASLKEPPPDISDYRSKQHAQTDWIRDLTRWQDRQRRLTMSTPGVIHPSKRDNQSVRDLMTMVRGTIKLVQDGHVRPQIGEHCGYCQMQDSCIEERKYIGPPVDRRGNRMFTFCQAPYDTTLPAPVTEMPQAEQTGFYYGRKEAWKGRPKKKGDGEKK